MLEWSRASRGKRERYATSEYATPSSDARERYCVRGVQGRNAPRVRLQFDVAAMMMSGTVLLFVVLPTDAQPDRTYAARCDVAPALIILSVFTTQRFAVFSMPRVTERLCLLLMIQAEHGGVFFRRHAMRGAGGWGGATGARTPWQLAPFADVDVLPLTDV